MPAFLHQGRVAFHETDAAGIVHFSNFLRLCEEAETHALASIGFLPSDAFLYPRVHVEADYRRPLRFWETYRIRAALTRIGRTSLHWHFSVESEEGICATVSMVSARLHAHPDHAAASHSSTNQTAATFSQEEKNRLAALLDTPSETDK